LIAAKGDGLSKPAELFPDSLVWAIVTVFIVGLGGTIGLMAVMQDVFGRSNLGLIIAFSLLILLMMLAVEGVLIWILFSRKRDAGKVDDTERLKEHPTKELAAAQPRALPEPLPSITEHTTRAFDPVLSERKSK
jgi:ABC-type phosphate/phosphonate transport system permease subunit